MIEITNEDNMELMARYPDKHFDLAIVDPPYGIGAGGNSFKSGTRVRASNFHRQNDWDLEIPKKEYWEELFRVSENQIVWGGNYMTTFLRPSKSWVFWDKGTGENSYADGELAWTSFDKVVKKYYKFWSGGNAKEKNDIDRCHPTQKPIALYEWLLMNYAKEGDKILDTHLGSGSIAIACHNLGFDLTACELDEDYYKAALKRLKQHQSQLTIF